MTCPLAATRPPSLEDVDPGPDTPLSVVEEEDDELDPTPRSPFHEKDMLAAGRAIRNAWRAEWDQAARLSAAVSNKSMSSADLCCRVCRCVLSTMRTSAVVN